MSLFESRVDIFSGSKVWYGEGVIVARFPHPRPGLLELETVLKFNYVIPRVCFASFPPPPLIFRSIAIEIRIRRQFLVRVCAIHFCFVPSHLPTLIFIV